MSPLSPFEGVWGQSDRLQIDEGRIRLLGLNRTTARYLRLTATGLKITADLKRISDYAVNIFERALESRMKGFSAHTSTSPG
jgi:phosphate uptake regulator